MRALFIRHGQATSNENPLNGTVGQPSNLTHEGLRQVQETAKFLGNFILTKTIYTSPLPRTRQTAQIVAEALQLEVIVDERLAEIYKGDWQGREVREVVELEAKVDIDDRPTFRPPNGENWEDVGKRVSDFIEEQRLSGQKEIVIVSHDHPIRMGIGMLLHTPLTAWEDMAIDHASVTELYYEEGLWHLHPTLVNVTPYLIKQLEKE